MSIKFKNYHKMTNNISQVSFIKVNLNVILLALMLISSQFSTPVMARKQTNRHQSTRRQQNQHGNISTLLDSLLENYDNSLRPNFGGDPAVIEVDIMVRSMGPVSEVDMVSITWLLILKYLEFLQQRLNNSFVKALEAHKLKNFKIIMERKSVF